MGGSKQNEAQVCVLSIIVVHILWTVGRAATAFGPNQTANQVCVLCMYKYYGSSNIVYLSILLVISDMYEIISIFCRLITEWAVPSKTRRRCVRLLDN